MKKNWFDTRAEAEQPAEISIYDDIGAYGVSARDFIAAISAITATTIKLSINSPGGSVFDALAMFNALRQHPATVEVTVMGVAASAASLVAMAGDKILMPDNAFMMIHWPWQPAVGNAAELRELADGLDKIGESLVTIYSNRSGQTPDKIRELLAAETWMTAQEALDLGFADEISPTMPVAARFDLERIPESIRTALGQALAPVKPDPVRGTSIQDNVKAMERALIGFAKARGIKLPEGVRLEPSSYIMDVVALCEAANINELADTAIQSKIPIAGLRQMIQQYRASSDQAIDINHHIPMPADGSLASQVWSHRRGES